MNSARGRLAFTTILMLIGPPIAAQLPADLALTQVATGVGNAVGARNAGDGSGRLFIINRDGAIRVRPAGSSTVLPTPFFSIGSAPFGFSQAGEGGLLGLAFHPDYAGNRHFYVSYTSGANDATIVRFTASAGNANVADPNSARVILRVDMDANYHKGGDLHFGADGYLYISVGDGAGGVSFDHCRRGQTLSPVDLAANDGRHGDCLADANFTSTGGNPDSRALQAKILRIDVDSTTPAGANELCASNDDGSANYAIPPGNPFAGTTGGVGNCDETYAYGLRNPFRFSVDRDTGDLFIGDVGEGQMEEIDFRAAGATGPVNYGWSFCEGTVPAPVAGATCAGFQPPILTYTHDANGGECSSITGGYRYRGSIAGLRGHYVYADYCTGRIHFAAPQAGGGWMVVDSWSGGPTFQYAGFGEDEDGELYLTELNSNRLLQFTSKDVNIDLIFENGFDPSN